MTGDMTENRERQRLSPGRRVALLIGSVLGVALIAWGAVNVWQLVTPQKTRQDTLTLPSQVARLGLDVGSGDVTVRRGTGPTSK